MSKETIVPGIGIGGLKDKYDIKILICYLLHTIQTPLSRDQLNYVFQDDQIVNYFSFCDALAELLETNHIQTKRQCNQEVFELNALGVETAKQLYQSLPTSLRDRVVTTAMKLLANIKNEKENEVIIKPYKNGYLVKCTIHEINFDLMSYEVFVPDLLQAEKIKVKFQEKPSKIYQGLIQLLLDD
ncbi:DUF4364 family protein [Paludicola sp. MB14-C6]|uniref:DUF4364 family protein n=1 Tax=Paludihabitans sp. MB14-C6 TaxID=3070656 RepID=UPI0027DC942C|nr:DUF4364 family protein [Paludicola sp. MB14-C6]WMJ23384.1 DUF4364 family protein [Paludicola sp. MB14-C6]